MEQVQLKGSGMSCTACEQRIEKALSRVDGVVRSAADHRNGHVRVVFDPGRASEESIRACIQQTGYLVLP